MSRGGRGGGRGGRLKGGRPEWEIGLVLDSKPSELFPPYKILAAAPATEKEKREVDYYLKFREEVKQSSMYSKSSTPAKTHKTYGEDQVNNQYRNKSKADVDPFVGVPRYSEKYEAKARSIPQISGPFNKDLFPKELWSTLEGQDGEAVRASINRAMKRKAGLFSEQGTQNALSKEDKIKTTIQDLDLDSDGEQRDEDEEEADHVYDDEDDEMADDYNAEQYFEDGADDDGDDGDGGGGEYS